VQFPWGIEAGFFSPKGKVQSVAQFPDSGSVPFISTRTWAPLYGIATLLDAFRIAHNRDPRLKLLLLNDGPEAGLVRDFIAKHKLEKVILTPGTVSREALPQWFRAARGYISCTLADGTSVSLLEAMATGLAVVVSDIPANREWVIEGENGALAQPGLADAFAAKLLWVANLDTDQRAAIAERNQKVVAERADWDKNFLRLLNFYEQLIAVSFASTGGKNSR